MRGTPGSSFHPNQTQETLEQLVSALPPPPTKHTTLRGTWRPGHGPGGMEHVCACSVAGGLGLAQKSGLWGARTSLLAASLHCPAWPQPGSPKAPCGGTRGGKSAIFLHPLARLKKTRNKTDEPPSEGSDEG